MNDLKDRTPLDRLIRQQVIQRGIHDERVLGALRRVPRDRFDPAAAQNSAFVGRAGPIGHAQTISEIYMVALMTERLQVEPEHKVLEIGTGSGYQTAVLAMLAGDVYTTERVKPLLDQAFERLMGMQLRNIHFRFGDGTLGWPEQAPFDRILITAGAPKIPTAFLKSQLRDGGIAVLPYGPEDEQTLVEIRRAGAQLKTANVCPCRFVKLIGREGWQAED